jgi:regulatory protein YycI of two-component signal transduction system YycFG
MILAIGLVILGKHPTYTGMTYEHPDFLLWCDQITDALLAIEAQTALPVYDGFPIKQEDYSSIYAHPNIIIHWLGSQLGETHPWVSFQLQKAGFHNFQTWLEALMNPENYDIPDTDGLPYQGLGGAIVNYYFLEERAHPPQILMIGWNAEVVRQYWKASLCAIQTWPHKFACDKKCKDASGLFQLTFEEPFLAFDQRKTLLAKCDQLIVCSTPDSLTQNLMDFAVQQGINVMLVNKTRRTFTYRKIYDHQCVTQGDGEVVELMQLPNSLAIVSMSDVDRVCFSASRDPVVYAHGNALSLEQLDIPFTTLKALYHWLNLFDTQEDELWDCKFGYYSVVQAMILLRAYCPEHVELLWWSTDTWITLEKLLDNKMDNPWMQFPGSNKVDLVSLEKCYFHSIYDPFAFWPERNDYAMGIFANLDDIMIDAVFGIDFSGEYMSFDQYDCECGNDHEFINRNLAMFERVLNAVVSKTDEELLHALRYSSGSYFIPTEAQPLRESLVDYLQFVIQKINETKAKGWYLGFVGY